MQPPECGCTVAVFAFASETNHSSISLNTHAPSKVIFFTQYKGD